MTRASHDHAPRRTQSERRDQTRKAVLDSASRLFGHLGYTATALEDIAQDCGLTTRPIYHYFGNKKALFIAVNGAMERRILDIVPSSRGREHSLQAWSDFLTLCEEPAFRQIVLIDSPKILGRERWKSSDIVRQVVTPQAGATACPARDFRSELQTRMLVSALAEAAMMVAESADPVMARREAEVVLKRLLSR